MTHKRDACLGRNPWSCLVSSQVSEIMRGSVDIGIIGGGSSGMSLARSLVTRGAKVAVIDAGASIPTATNAAAGMLAPSFECGG